MQQALAGRTALTPVDVVSRSVRGLRSRARLRLTIHIAARPMSSMAAAIAAIAIPIVAPRSEDDLPPASVLRIVALLILNSDFYYRFVGIVHICEQSGCNFPTSRYSASPALDGTLPPGASEGDCGDPSCVDGASGCAPPRIGVPSELVRSFQGKSGRYASAGTSDSTCTDSLWQ